MNEIGSRNVWECSSFLVELEKIFHFTELENLDSFSSDDYQFFLYLIEHWKRLLIIFPSAEQIELPEEILLREVEFDESKKLILERVSEIKKRFRHLDKSFDYHYLEKKFFQKYEAYQLRELKAE
jgi:hypothetical protein